MNSALSNWLGRVVEAVFFSIYSQKSTLLSITAILLAVPLNSTSFSLENSFPLKTINLDFYPSNPDSQKAFSNKNCTFPQTVALRNTQTYGIFGDDEFDTLVCGYLIKRNIEVFGEQQTNAYLRIVDFYDGGFKNSIEKGVREGNTVNLVENGNYDFNLGCWQNDKIVIDESENVNYIDNLTQEKIAKSSPIQPVSVILSFSKHSGSDYYCLSLAEQIRIY